jgi:hypothetical protein
MEIGTLQQIDTKAGPLQPVQSIGAAECLRQRMGHLRN